MADDDQMADVWFNIGHIGISLGDLGLAYQAFKVAVSVDPQHGEALNNIAVLEMRRQKFDFAKSCFHTACEVCPHSFEPFYNSALMAYRMVSAAALRCIAWCVTLCSRATSRRPTSTRARP